MYETTSSLDRGLEPETRRRMHEVFDGQTCCECGAPAVRFRKDRFFCAAHFSHGGHAGSYQARVYHCSAADPG
jgi:hypothetical protein